MTDAEYMFRQTSAERKRNGRGDFNKKRKGGRFVRLPSDNLTAKEKRALNGTVEKYNLNKPVSWAEFKKWPKDLACEYIRRLEEAYNVRTEDLARMMGIGLWSMRQHRKMLGCPAHVGGKREPVDFVGWSQFITEEDADVRAVLGPAPEVIENLELPEKKEEKTYTIRDACVEHMKEEVKQIDIHNIATLLQALAGTGAKLTIEVTL